jgi:hypothetical protein
MRRGKLVRIISVCVVCVAALALWRLPISAVHLGVFELEGDAVDDPNVAGDDWNSAGGGTAIAQSFTADGSGNRTIFTGGGSKDGIDISSWAWKDDAGGLPDKDNITNAYARAYTVNGDLILYYGADRFANDGDAQLGFWFFQNNVTLNANGSFNGTHAVGDILVLANLTNGGAVVTIQVLEWVGTGGNQRGGTLQLLLTEEAAKCGTHTDDRTCAISNDLPTTSPWAYTPKAGPSGTFPQFSFFEGGINITALLGTPPCFAAFLAETRSSQSVSATLKDFTLGAFPVCGISITKACDSATYDPATGLFTDHFSGTVTNTGIGTLYNVTVTDTPSNGTPQTFNLGTLAGGQSATFSGTFTTTQNPATNNASVVGSSSPDGTGNVSATADQATCPTLALNPRFSVDKTCTVVLVVVNGVIQVAVDYRGTVCAASSTSGGTPSDVFIDSVSVRDDNGTPDPSTGDDTTISIGSLAPGACATYSGRYFPGTVPISPVSFSDTVHASGTGRQGVGAVSSVATANCPLCPQ